MWIEEVDVRREPGIRAMRELRQAFALDMSQRYPDSNADYGPESLPSGMHQPDGGFLVLYDNSVAVGCVGFRKLPAAFADNIARQEGTAGKSAEGKSLFILPRARGHLGAALLMRALVQSAIEHGYEWLYGNTGVNQPESVRVLKGAGALQSEQIPLYDPANPLAAYAFRLDLRAMNLGKLAQAETGFTW